jgi:hypothetical protein
VQDLSVLTPPLLMCAAVLFAVGAFLRHEMRKKGPDQGEASSPEAELADAPDERGDSSLSETSAPADTPRKH